MSGGSGDPPDTHMLCCDELLWEECDGCPPEMEELKNDCRGAKSEYHWFASYGSCLCGCTGCVPDLTMKFTLDGDPPNSCDPDGEPVVTCETMPTSIQFVCDTIRR